MEYRSLAAHEIMEFHEMLNFKTTCLLKSEIFAWPV